MSFQPALNATLNGLAGCCLLAGFYFIRKRRIAAHRACMLTAAMCSTLFLISYVIYHSQAGITRFAVQGFSRYLYFGILFTHTPLAVILLPLVILTLRRALKADFARHKRLAHWTWPVWMYVSVTGVLIYFMLYQWFPGV